MIKIDPKNIGQSTAGDEFCDPHGDLPSPNMGGHVGMARDGEGNFTKSMSEGGVSSDGDAMVAKYRPRSSATMAEPLETGYGLNDEGDGWM